MIKFEVTLTLTAEELSSFFEQPIFVGKPIKINPVRETDTTPAAWPKTVKTSPSAPRKARGSKVEQVIRAVLAEGPHVTSDIKEKLTAAGLKPSSFGTVAYKLQKEGMIGRNSHGEWALLAA